MSSNPLLLNWFLYTSLQTQTAIVYKEPHSKTLFPRKPFKLSPELDEHSTQ